MGERTWIIEYSIKRKAGDVQDSRAKIMAATISQAIELATKNIIEIWKKDPSVADAKIWDVGIACGEPVF